MPALTVRCAPDAVGVGPAPGLCERQGEQDERRQRRQQRQRPERAAGAESLLMVSFILTPQSKTRLLQHRVAGVLPGVQQARADGQFGRERQRPAIYVHAQIV